jgi:hypothetical protein
MNIRERLAKLFWDAQKIASLNGNEAILYFYFVETFLALGAKQDFWHSDMQTMNGVGLALNTVKKARKRLVEVGLISFTRGEHGVKTRYTMCGVEAGDTILPVQKPVEKSVEKSDVFVGETGLIQSGTWHGLTLLTHSDSQNTHSNSQKLTDIISSSHPQKKTEKKQTELFVDVAAEVKRPEPPTTEQVMTFITELVCLDNGREDLNRADRELIIAITHKYHAARVMADWRTDSGVNTGRCMILYWKDRARAYYNSAKFCVKGNIAKCLAAEKQAAATEQIGASKLRAAQEAEQIAANKKAYYDEKTAQNLAATTTTNTLENPQSQQSHGNPNQPQRKANNHSKYAGSRANQNRSQSGNDNIAEQLAAFRAAKRAAQAA